MQKLKNALFLTLVFLLNLLTPKKRPLFKRPKILIVSTTGLGDTLWSLPVLKSIRLRFPKASIHLLTNPLGKGLLENHKAIDKIFTTKQSILLSWLSLFRPLRREKFEVVLLFHTSDRFVLPLVSSIGASIISGTRGLQKGLDSLLTHPVEEKYEHQVTRRFRIASALLPKGDNLTPSPAFPTLPVSDTALKRIDSLLENLGVGKKETLIIFHPGAKDSFRQWPIESFIKLGKSLSIKKACTLLVTGQEVEKPLAKKLLDEVPGSLSLAGRLSIRDLMALFKRASLVVTNDTGPMHLAHHLKTPLIALFVPSDPHLSAPYPPSPSSHILKREETCTPCLKRKCQDPFCLRQISPKEVLRQTEKILGFS